MNVVMLTGNLGADPESRQAGDTTVCNLRVATSGREKVDGQWQEKSDWHRVTCFGKTAELAAQYLRKGSKVGIRGRISYRKWSKDGVDTWSTDIVADEVEFLSPKGDSGGGSRSGGSSYPDSDVPF
jgi:single-strand DNA-binding protein